MAHVSTKPVLPGQLHTKPKHLLFPPDTFPLLQAKVMGHPPPPTTPGAALDPKKLVPRGRPQVLGVEQLGRQVQLDLEGGVDWEWLEGLQRSQR